MPDDGPRFLLGYGERLTEGISPPLGGGGPEPPYELAEAIAHLTPMISDTASNLQSLPRAACPDGQAVGLLTMHPQAIAKSYHPRQLLEQINLWQVGSRPVQIEPKKWTRKIPPEPSPSTEIFVAGARDSFTSWANTLSQLAPYMPASAIDQLRRLEKVRAPTIEDRYRGPDLDRNAQDRELVLEVVLHASNSPDSQSIVAAFEQYALSLSVRPEMDRRLYAGGLCFLPVEAPVEALGELLLFSFLRVARPMPRLRAIPPIERAIRLQAEPSPLPDVEPVDPDLRVAIFDGGLSSDVAIERWVDAVTPPDVGDLVPELAEHGHSVASALLFGSLMPGQESPQPYARAEVYQVLDEKSSTDPFELYDALRRIQNVLSERNHKFFNISVGPAVPVEDGEVHAWTAVLDEHLSDGNALGSIAIGNNGDKDRASGEARIQVPGDCVNGLSVGAANSSRAGWSKARYSAYGPGRSPGRVKPDLLHFGGDPREPFIVYDPENAPAVSGTRGTSFAAPAALRAAIGVRAHFGERISPLGLKALLVHCAEDYGLARSEVGWGAVSSSIEDLVICPNGSVRVLYQGELNPAQYLRAVIPLPDESLSAKVTLTASFCYATPVDPQDPGSYTRSGLDVVFRPHAQKYRKRGTTEPMTRPFFQRSDYDSERELRNDGQKWETVMRASHTLQGRSLFRPVFDIHYNARSGGGQAIRAARIRYALVVSATTKRNIDLYDMVVRKYAGQLEALRPLVEIPIRT